MAYRRQFEKIYLEDEENYESINVRVTFHGLEADEMMFQLDLLSKVLHLKEFKIPMSRFGTWVFQHIQKQSDVTQIIDVGGCIAAITYALFTSYPEITVSMTDTTPGASFTFDVRRQEKRRILNEIGNKEMDRKVEKALKNIPGIDIYKNKTVTVQVISKPKETEEHKEEDEDPISEAARKKKIQRQMVIASLIEQEEYGHAIAGLKQTLEKETDAEARMRILIQICMCYLQLEREEELDDSLNTIIRMLKNVKIPSKDIPHHIMGLDLLYILLQKKGCHIQAIEVSLATSKFMKQIPDPNQRIEKLCVTVKQISATLLNILNMKPGMDVITQARKYVEKMEKDLVAFMKQEKDCSTLVKYRSLYFSEFSLTSVRNTLHDEDGPLFMESNVEFAQSPNYWADIPFVAFRLARHPDTKAIMEDEDFRQNISAISKDPKLLQKYLKDLKIARADEVLKSNFLLKEEDEDKSKPSGAKKSDEEFEFGAGCFGPTKIKKEKSKAAKKPKPKSKQEEAEMEKEKGNEAYRNKEFDSALWHYDKAIELDPTNAMLYSNKAAVYMEQKKLDLCRKACLEAVDVSKKTNRHSDKEMARILARLAKVEYQLENYHIALPLYQRSYNLHPDDKVLEDMLTCENILEMVGAFRAATMRPRFGSPFFGW